MLTDINNVVKVKCQINVNIQRLDEGQCHRGSPAEDDNIREEGTNSCKSTDMIYINITHVARDRYRDRDRWRDTGVKCYIGTLVTILVCTMTQLCLMILHIMFKLQTTKPQQF